MKVSEATPVHQALREALVNCIVNADYYGRQGLVIIKKRDNITFSNPGNFRIEIYAAKSGGVSDPKKSSIKESKKDAIISYLTDNAQAKTSEIAEYIGLQPSRTRDYLKELVGDGIVVAEGENKNRVYRLKS